MSLREIQFIKKFLAVPGSFFLFTEYFLTLTQNRLQIIQRAQLNHEVLKIPGQAEVSQMAFRDMLTIRNTLQYIMENQMPDASVFRRLNSLLDDYEITLMNATARVIGLPKEHISQYETFDTFLTRLTNDLTVLPHAKMIANELVSYHIDYINLICKIVERNSERGRHIGLCRNALYHILIELNSIQTKIQSGNLFNPINLSTPELRQSDPLYALMRRCYVLVETCSQHRPADDRQ